MKSTIKKAFLLITMIFAINFAIIPAHAASNQPYGYTYEDAATYKTVYRFYSWNTQKKTYNLSREFYSKGSYVYTDNGALICNVSAGNGARYNGFDKEGNFYIVTKNGSTLKIDKLNKTTVLINKDSIKLNYDADELAYSMSTKTGNVFLSNLKPAPEVDNDDNYAEPEKPKAKNRVDIYTNSANELVYEGFKNNKLNTRIIVSSNGSKVLNATAKVRLSDTLKGAKFLGMDPNYNVYLYETGNLYRFKSGKWYSAEKLELTGKYKSFKKDKNGFISKVTTSKTSYSLKQLTTPGKWKASKTYAVSKNGYTTLYTKGSTSSKTLILKSDKLSLNGKKIASSVKKFGFVNSRKLVYIKKNGTVYTASLSNPQKTKKIYSGGKSLKTSSGLVTNVITSKGSKKI